jgi:thermostable 8-oxoguanine DNA glycosylase
LVKVHRLQVNFAHMELAQCLLTQTTTAMACHLSKTTVRTGIQSTQKEDMPVKVKNRDNRSQVKKMLDQTKN